MDATYTIAVLLGLIVLAEWLARQPVLRHFGTALLVILFAAILANTGLIPSASSATPLYAGIFHYVAPLAIFLLLLQVNLAEIRHAGLAMLGAFALGSVATVAGVIAGLWTTPLLGHLGDLAPAVGGMFAATYTGGSINFNAIALHYGVNEHGALYAGALAVDNIMTMIWMLVTLFVPRLLGNTRLQTPAPVSTTAGPTKNDALDQISLPGTTIILTLAAGSIWLSDVISGWSNTIGVSVPSILILTTFALLLAQFSQVRRIGGTRVMGLLSVYLFLAVIGAHAELAALNDIGPIAVSFLYFATVLLVVHGLIIFSVGWFFHDWPLVAIASQANIGGAATAIALAETFDRDDLLFPAILVGALGTATGTYIGFAVARFLAL